MGTPSHMAPGKPGDRPCFPRLVSPRAAWKRNPTPACHGKWACLLTFREGRMGLSAVFDLEGEFGYASYLIRLRADNNLANPLLVAHSINSPIGRAYMLSEKKRMTGQANGPGAVFPYGGEDQKHFAEPLERDALYREIVYSPVRGRKPRCGASRPEALPVQCLSDSASGDRPLLLE